VNSLHSSPITIRPADADDAITIMRLAALDSAPVPHGPLLLAEVHGEPRVAVSVVDGTAIADPFRRTSELVELLRDHVGRTGVETSTARRRSPARAWVRRPHLA
jgi:hypothetical protein